MKMGLSGKLIFSKFKLMLSFQLLYILFIAFNLNYRRFFFPALYYCSAAEFIIYKLKEMGKISQEDIALVMEEFQDLDFDQSGTLSQSDLFLAQGSQTKS